MLTSTTGIVLPPGLAGWYRATASWVITTSTTNNASFTIYLTDFNTFVNFNIALQGQIYNNGGSGFGPVQGGGTLGAVFNVNSGTSDVISLQMLNPAATTVQLTAVVLTIEYIGGNI